MKNKRSHSKTPRFAEDRNKPLGSLATEEQVRAVHSNLQRTAEKYIHSAGRELAQLTQLLY